MHPYYPQGRLILATWHHQVFDIGVKLSREPFGRHLVGLGHLLKVAIDLGREDHLQAELPWPKSVPDAQARISKVVEVAMAQVDNAELFQFHLMVWMVLAAVRLAPHLLHTF